MKIFLAILVTFALLLATGCEPRKEEINKKFDRSGEPVVVTIYTYDSQRELDAAFREIHNIARGDDVDSRYGFARWHEWRDPEGNLVEVERECEVHIVKPEHVDDEATLTLGHELLHCLYGSYHE